MKTIQQIEELMRHDHRRGIRAFASSEFDTVTLVSMLTAAYLSGQEDAVREELECLKKAPASR